MTQTRSPLTAAGRLMDGPTLERTVTRLAHEVREQHPGLEGVVLAAVRDGGVPLARLLAATLKRLGSQPVPLLALDVTAYRDDRPRVSLPPQDALATLDGGAPASVEGATVVLVDDVLHTGRTLRAALDCLAAHGRPAAVEPLVLFDRGQRELPLRATFVGRNVPVAAGQWVEVLAWDAEPGATGAWLVTRA